MQNLKNKTTIAITMLITLLLTSTTLVAIIFTAFPPAGTEIPSYSKINVGPNPIGIGQTVTVNMYHAIPTFTSEFYENMTVEVTDPDGHTTTLGPFTSDATGGTYTTFVPDQLGIWKFQMFYPGQTLSSGHIQMPGESRIAELTVQQEQVTRESYPPTPGPQNYWETPVSAMNAENWYWQMGEWWGLRSITFEQTGGNVVGNYNPYTESAYTGHVLWTKPWGAGGVAGGESGPGQITGHFWTTRQYQPQYAPVILEGIMYAVLYTGSRASGAHNGIVATDLYTGETLWTINTQELLRCGYSPTWHNLNEYGTVGPYIITTGDHPGVNTTGTTYNFYDGKTGKYIASIINGEGMYLTLDDDRDIVGYYQDLEVEVDNVTERHLVKWDMTDCLRLSTNNEPGWAWGLSQDREYDFEDGIVFSEPMWNFSEITGVTDPDVLEGGGWTGLTFAINGITNDEVLFTGGFTFGQGFGGTTNGWLTVGAMDKNTGARLWARNITYAETSSLLPYTRCSMTIHDGLWINLNLQNYAMFTVNTRTGVEEWTLTLTGDNGGLPHWYNSFGLSTLPGPGVTLVRGFGGDIWCIDDAEGTVRWYTNTTKLVGAPGAENPYGIWPLWVFGCELITNNVAYFPIGHEYNPPMFPGAQMLAVNIADGSLVWSELGMYIRSTSAAYNIVLSLNAYDNQIYAFGKGPSATTVTAPAYGTLGESIAITGTVTDICAGSEQHEQAMRFPNGLPCVSDEDQSHFMEYVYQEQVLDYEVEGVEVVLTTLDPNGNTYELGRTTSSQSGVYGLTIDPPVPGLYKIIATFDGSDSYWGSYAETSLSVGPAPEEPTEPAVQADINRAVDSLTPIFYGTIVAVVVAIVIGIVNLWALRKRT